MSAFLEKAFSELPKDQVFFSSLTRGLYEHQKKVSIYTEEGTLSITSLSNGVKRVSFLCLESLVAWPLLIVARLVEGVAVWIMTGIIFTVSKIMGSGRIDFKTVGIEMGYLTASVVSGLRFSILEIAYLFQYFVESQVSGPTVADAGTMTDSGERV